jgi:callose synthase
MPFPRLQVSGGNGEQVMSRDVHRLSTQFDFFRLMSFYHSGEWVGVA